MKRRPVQLSRDQLDPDRRGLLEALLGDGRFLIILTGICLALAGGFALFQSATGHFLPHDITFLGMTAEELCRIHECRIVHFMFHDRVSFGGVLIAIGAVYMWLAEFPLKRLAPWAWWTLAISGAVGFASFMTYLGYGYLDSWHGAATLILLPCFVTGLARSWPTLADPKNIRVLLRPSSSFGWAKFGVGRLCLLFTSLGIIGAGLTITIVGMTTVFVPQDLQFMGLTVEYLQDVNPRLVPLIAHDRAGFGGGLCSGGIALTCLVWCAAPSRHLWQILALAGGVGFACAIGIHFMVGYTDMIHLAPAALGAILFAVGLVFTFKSMMLGSNADDCLTIE
jgi:hypothetical protein